MFGYSFVYIFINCGLFAVIQTTIVSAQVKRFKEIDFT